MSRTKPNKPPLKLDYAAPPPTPTWREWWWRQCKGLLLLFASLVLGVVLFVIKGHGLWTLAAIVTCVFIFLVHGFIRTWRLRKQRGPQPGIFLLLVLMMVLTICAIVEIAVTAVEGRIKP